MTMEINLEITIGRTYNKGKIRYAQSQLDGMLKKSTSYWGKVSYLLDTFAEMYRRKPMMYHGADS